MEKVKIRGLAHLIAALFGLWGSAIAVKALYDLFAGEPEANFYAPVKWAFVTQEQWLRYGGFELAYGLSCLALAWAVFKYSRFLPEVIERSRREPELKLFD